ncbi:uncharacterized protein LOC112563122 [Pomacea canaliculata]|uniref:uncharacterized protein LOC112563122 n=1 Tax=Pomacea canaliculata TaxID=400727 RepID=UPI000D730158|nr:uncharacterized protein LOC112563122 [Pomacea canaliculata]
MIITSKPTLIRTICFYQQQQSRHLKPSVCSQCGNLDGDLPCTDEEIFEADSSQCHDDTPYCMNDIIQTNGQMRMYKRCVNETICNSEWYMESSDKQQCTQFDPSIYKDDLVCHLCCYGDDCNANNVPPAEKLYKP